MFQLFAVVKVIFSSKAAAKTSINSHIWESLQVHSLCEVLYPKNAPLEGGAPYEVGPLSECESSLWNGTLQLIPSFFFTVLYARFFENVYSLSDLNIF